MKLIVIIPAFNEEKSLPSVIKSIPTKIPGISKIEVLVLNDGSTDATVRVAKKAGATYAVSHSKRAGLATSFKDAVAAALFRGADIIVNTDADNQYDQREIGKLIQPILKKEADLVIGDRQVATLSHMPWQKKYGNRLGSFVIRWLTGTSVRDASSGFRAFTAECARSLMITSAHTYTHEMIIDAHFKNKTIVDIPITFRERKNGVSRLIAGNIIQHVMKSAATIIRTILLYKAFRVFSTVGSVIIGSGVIGIVRFLVLSFLFNESKGHVQSLILSSILIAMGFNILILGFIADLIAYNRGLLEEIKKN